MEKSEKIQKVVDEIKARTEDYTVDGKLMDEEALATALSKEVLVDNPQAQGSINVPGVSASQFLDMIPREEFIVLANDWLAKGFITQASRDLLNEKSIPDPSWRAKVPADNKANDIGITDGIVEGAEARAALKIVAEG